MTQYNHPSQPTNGQIAPKMRGKNPIYRHSSKKPLQWAGVMIDNDPTTKYIAVMPNRHSLAFFVPKNHGVTILVFATGAKRHVLNALASHGGIASYDGLIRPNTKAFMVNKSSRLYTVVETRHPIVWSDKNTTKYIGGNNHA